MRFADPQTGQVAIFGVVQETTTRSPYATRLKVVDRAVAEAETIVVRPEDAGIPFVTADIKVKPVWNEMLPAAQRTPRQKMIDVANGYFETLQLQRRHAAHTVHRPTATGARTACSPPTMCRWA